MENFDIDEFYLEHNLRLNFSQSESEIIFRIDLLFRDKRIGKCTLHALNDEVLFDCEDVEKTLYWFFDDIEAVASNNFSDICQNNELLFNDMLTYRFVYLTGMFIEPEYRNKGVGSIFIQSIEEMLRFMRINRIFLVSAMYKDNDTPYRNESFYIKNGFNIINNSGDIYDGKMMYKCI